MKKKIIIGSCSLLICAVVLFSILIYYTPSNKNNESTVQNIPFDVIALDESTGSNGVVYADYSDYKDSLDAIIEEADLIIIGKTSKRLQFSNVAVRSSVSVLKTLKGTEFNEIDIFQLGNLESENILSEGQEYILLLGKQEDGKENTFFIKGGDQGKLISLDEKIISNDPIVSKDLKKIIDSDKYIKNGKDIFEQYLNRDQK